jgi:hypothetical protein
MPPYLITAGKCSQSSNTWGVLPISLDIGSALISQHMGRAPYVNGNVQLSRSGQAFHATNILTMSNSILDFQARCGDSAVEGQRKG